LSGLQGNLTKLSKQDQDTTASSLWPRKCLAVVRR